MESSSQDTAPVRSDEKYINPNLLERFVDIVNDLADPDEPGAGIVIYIANKINSGEIQIEQAEVGSSPYTSAGFEMVDGKPVATIYLDETLLEADETPNLGNSDVFRTIDFLYISLEKPEVSAQKAAEDSIRAQLGYLQRTSRFGSENYSNVEYDPNIFNDQPQLLVRRILGEKEFYTGNVNREQFATVLEKVWPEAMPRLKELYLRARFDVSLHAHVFDKKLQDVLNPQLEKAVETRGETQYTPEPEEISRSRALFTVVALIDALKGRTS
jgi:hypothetical protein